MPRRSYSLWNAGSSLFFGDSALLTLRFLPPEKTDAEDLAVLVRAADGSWQEKIYNTDGSYLVFSVDAGENALCIIQAHNPFSSLILPAILAAVAAGILLVWSICRKKKKVLSGDWKCP